MKTAGRMKNVLNIIKLAYQFIRDMRVLELGHLYS